MEPVTGLGIAGQALAAFDTAAALPAGAKDAERFAVMMQAPVPDGVPLVLDAQTAAPLPPPAAATPGDAILEGLRNAGNDLRVSWDSMKAALDKTSEHTTIAEMLRMQMQMIQLSVQVELVGKGISRSTQNIEQLIKIQ